MGGWVDLGDTGRSCGSAGLLRLRRGAFLWCRFVHGSKLVFESSQHRSDHLAKGRGHHFIWKLDDVIL